MLKLFKVILIMVLSFGKVLGQYAPVAPFWRADLTCHVNVNGRPDQMFRDDIKRAVFKLTVAGTRGSWNCSATLLNRNTGQTQLGQYFVTAWHCFKNGTNCGEDEVNLNQFFTMTFNYQSPNGNTEVFQQNANGNIYQIQRQVELVDKFVCAYGDFALCRILGDPIPPHFNVYYAGWNPNQLLKNLNSPFAMIHHPSGSIKKISGVNTLFGGGNIATTSCVTVTKVIDFLFGWIWRRKWSTQVICTYTQIPVLQPRYSAVGFAFGSAEGGSSGGGLFTSGNKLFGTLSGGPDHYCNFPDVVPSFWGKFSDSYYRQVVKNNLNPPHKYWIDETGIPGRQITCYPQLNIGSAAGALTTLYPARYYQVENQLSFTSRSDVDLNNVEFPAGADYSFQAGAAIQLNAVNIAPGAIVNLTPNTAPCVINEGTYKVNGPADEVSEYDTPEIYKLLEELPYPEKKPFDINKYLPAKTLTIPGRTYSLNIFPNPTKGFTNIDAFFQEKEKFVLISVYDLTGRLLASKEYKDVYFIRETLDVSSLASGVYTIGIKTNNFNQVSKLVVGK